LIPALRTLTAEDIPAAMWLVDQVGWNQTPADWARFLAASPDGCFGAVIGTELVGTSATIVYGGSVAWIGMVIVDLEHRSRGIGRELLRAACEDVDRRGIRCAKLDATPLGEPLYEKDGFRRERRLERWDLTRELVPGPPAVPASPISDDALDLDSRLFGADRRFLLASLRAEAPDLALEVRGAIAVRGYALGRRGLRADHLGPWMARDEDVAARLLDTFLSRSTAARLFVDVVVDHPFARRLLESRGFQHARPLVRMFRGDAPRADDRELLAVVGPEFG
jgi:GNAT superfamily N-acetyltransferase